MVGRMITVIVPEETDIIAAGAEAAALGLHLICNGHQTRISRLVPPGWFKVAVKIHPDTPRIEGILCAA